MSRAKPRLRMFAGPNGSGKSTIKAVVEAEIGADLLGVYLNADDIEADVGRSGCLTAYGVTTTADEVLGYFRKSKLLADKGLSDAAAKLKFSDNKVSFAAVEMDSYFASVAVDFLRNKLVQSGVDFTFETVMSHPSKVEFLKFAQESGVRTYLYFVATEDPEIRGRRGTSLLEVKIPTVGYGRALGQFKVKVFAIHPSQPLQGLQRRVAFSGFLQFLVRLVGNPKNLRHVALGQFVAFA